jgi:hypothetical protein
MQHYVIKVCHWLATGLGLGYAYGV